MCSCNFSRLGPGGKRVLIDRNLFSKLNILFKAEYQVFFVPYRYIVGSSVPMYFGKLCFSNGPIWASLCPIWSSLGVQVTC